MLVPAANDVTSKHHAAMVHAYISAVTSLQCLAYERTEMMRAVYTW